jgi:mono/diheme cytochrome c family protein
MVAMLRSWWIRILITAILVAVAIVTVRRHVASGQDTDDRLGNAAFGRRLIDAWCTECHSVEPALPGVKTTAPDFRAIAQRPSTTAISLRVFLQSEPKTMPHFIIGRRDTDNIIAYILSLRQ